MRYEEDVLDRQNFTDLRQAQLPLPTTGSTCLRGETSADELAIGLAADGTDSALQDPGESDMLREAV